ncbi:acetyl-CoA hydrolase/transferase family protein [Thalassotalea euphylliae]|uniref:4-hydroxybutyrate CoA-transferase n=1 Tax=Thalassotalea euphylliae TaxID=1655234 RepID=A0A3E0U0Q4_9GAMM|nr:acetyl-CoA hydrolase/transferase C-terminal domain-containing protein [Thalassotalea euphylliae]REL29805.1 4-hydroxybutyrate CoA-transferase [Thalassotalea euphylliae]
MSNWQSIYDDKLVSLQDAAQQINSHDKIWAGIILSVPVLFLKTLEQRYTELENCQLYTGILTTPYDFLKPEYRPHIEHHSVFMGALERKAQKTGNITHTNFHLSNTGRLFDRIAFNVIAVEVTPPNAEGYMSLGACGGLGYKEAIKHADKVIAVVNNQQPFIGDQDNLIHVDEATWITEGHHPIAGPKAEAPGALETAIAKHVVPFVQDNSTIQIGIGSISNAVGMALKDKKGLGIHTEMFTESMMELCKAGAVTNQHKNYKPNKIVTAFTAGSQALIDFVNNNPDIEMSNVTTVVNPVEIAKNDNFVSINTCVLTDLTGQVASEGVGFTQISGTGGQVDFIRGATLSKGGISILVLASTHQGKNGVESTIRTALPLGTAVTTLRNDVMIIATEHGAADLRGLNVPERVEALIAIAHPDFRNELRKDAIDVGLLS